MITNSWDDLRKVAEGVRGHSRGRPVDHRQTNADQRPYSGSRNVGDQPICHYTNTPVYTGAESVSCCWTSPTSHVKHAGLKYFPLDTMPKRLLA